MLYLLLALATGLKLPLYPIQSPIDLKSSADFQYVFNYYNSYYYTILSIGTPPINFTVLIDTGSTYLWVPSYDCVDCTSAYHYYDSSNSSSSTPLNQERVLKYSEANLTGQAYLEKVSTSDSLVASQVLIFNIIKNSGLKYLPSDGILGLGFSNKLDGYLNLVDQLKSEGAIANSTFSIYLNDNILGAMSETKPEANIIFGGYDMKYAQEEFRYIGIYKNSGFWFTSLQSIQVDLLNLTLTSKYAIFHTGAAMIQGPLKDIEVLQNYISQGSSCYSFNGYRLCSCKEYSEYPVFKFVLGGKVFELGPENYLAKVSGWCMGLFQEIEGVEAIVLGLPFLRNYYTTYNLEKGYVGLALATKSQLITSTQSSMGTSVFILSSIALTFLLAYKKYSSHKSVDPDYNNYTKL